MTVVIQKCEENNTDFVLLPPNSTHLTQPFDVAVFRPLKMRWRKVLETFKNTTVGRLRKALPKDAFPSLLSEVMTEMQHSVGQNLKSGFRKCGIHPLDPLQVIPRLPQEQQVDSAGIAADLDNSVIDMLKEMRHGSGEASTTAPKRKKRLAVAPGKSITTESSRTEDTSTEHTEEEEHNVEDPQEHQATSSTGTTFEDSTVEIAPQPGTSTQRAGDQEPTAQKAQQPGTSTQRTDNQDPTTNTAPQPGTSTQRIGNQNVGEVAPSDWVLVKVPVDSTKTAKYRYFIAVVVDAEPDIPVRVRFLQHVRGTGHTFINPKIDDYSDIDHDDIIKVLPEPDIDKKC